MTEITIDEIRPLIADQRVQGSQVHVTFTCPKTGVTHESSAGIRRGQGIANTALRAAKQSMWYSLRSSLMRAVSSALGSGMAGRVGRQVGNQVLRDMTQGANFTGEDVENAIVDAFTRVQNNFRKEGETWVAAHGQVAPEAVDSSFNAQLRQAPITERYDQGVLARVLVELAKGDGQLSGEEQALIAGFLDPSLGTVDQLATRPPLSAVELGETSAEVRDTILMLGWALALSDKELAASEQARLNEITAGLGIDAGRAAELKGLAQGFLLDQALDAAYRSGSQDADLHRQAMEIAAAIGLSSEEAERADVRYRKTRGIV